MSVVGIIIAAIWIIGIFFAYFFYFRTSTGNKTFENVWLSCVWPLCIPLAIVHWLRNYVADKRLGLR